jgi:hypothetical protein
MKGVLSVVASLCVTAVVVLSILPGPLYRLHSAGHGGTNVVLVPAGDDGPGGH